MPLTQNSPWSVAQSVFAAHFALTGVGIVEPSAPASEPPNTTQNAPWLPSAKAHIPQLWPGLQSVLAVLTVQAGRHSFWTQRCPVAHFDSSQKGTTVVVLEQPSGSPRATSRATRT